jgi:hydroxymethylbilane synthase
MLRIGTRDSELAIIQANEVAASLTSLGIPSELVYVKTSGDLNPEKPIHQFGSVGIFTKELDSALLENRIDVAVHSCKDLPSELDTDFTIAACLPREDAADVLICRTDAEIIFQEDYLAVIATGSVRRKAAWKSRYPNHTTVEVRGNIKTRIQKLNNNNWDGLIMASAALKRLKINLPEIVVLDWLVPSPAQGIIAVVCKKSDRDIIQQLKRINHRDSFIAATVERNFLHLMEGGCVAPIGALAEIKNDTLFLKCSVMSVNGKEKVEFELQSSASDYATLGAKAFLYAQSKGAVEIINAIKNKS